MQRDESCFENTTLKRKTAILIPDEFGFETIALKKKGSYLTRTVCISVIAFLLFLPYDHDDDNDNDYIYCLSPDNLIRGAGNAFRGNQITRL